MYVLINTSNLKVGGGIQVADSLIHCLFMYRQHNFVIVLSPALSYLDVIIDGFDNCTSVIYSIQQNIQGVFWGKNIFLDNVVEKYNVDVVFTVFGPSLWRPKVKHICGFARSQLIYSNSPFFQKMNWVKRIYSKIRENMKLYNFKITSDWLITESNDVRDKLSLLLKNKQIYTVTNYYNQIFDCKEKWKDFNIKKFDGITLLTISANHPHKNLQIIPKVLDYIDEYNIPLNLRFVVTLSCNEMQLKEKYKDRILLIGKVDINTCPSLYDKADIMFLPTLLECFSASYPEAMKMGKPILTSDLSFAHSLCGDAALYFDPLSPQSIVEAIQRINVDKILVSVLIENGRKQLHVYDNAEQRCDKIIKLLEKIYCNK